MGNITFKTGQGTYAYDPATDRLGAVGAHDYDDNGNVLEYGNKAGPSADMLHRRYGAWKHVTGALGRSSPRVNRMTGN